MTRFIYNARRRKKVGNIVRSLTNRQYCNVGRHRENLRILRCLILADHVYYEKVFERSSNKPILYEGDRIFMDNHRTCLTINGKHLRPASLFTLPPCTSKEKIEDVLIIEATLSCIPLKKRSWRPCILCVTANNHLIRYDLDTGEELERIYLHDRYQFRYLSMEDEAETIVIRSKHMTQDRQNVYKAVCVFAVFPLRFLCMFEVERKVFGKDIVDCMLYQGLMINKYSNGTIRFFDYNKMREKYTLFEARLDCHPADKPLPINLRIAELPADLVLFEIRCYGHDLHIGGSPWQYVQAHGPKHFSVHALGHQYQLTPGIRLGDGQDLSDGIESDRAMFHPDDSGRIIYVTTQRVTVYKLLVGPCGPLKLQTVFAISARDPQLSSSRAGLASGLDETVIMTSSGRRSRRVRRENVIENVDEVTLDGLDYEDELDLTTACHITPTNRDGYQGRLCFYDNEDGSLLKEMVLEEEWDEFGEHLVVLDRDVIVHIVKSMNNKYTVHFYRLSRRFQNGDDQQPHDRLHPPSPYKAKTKPKRGRRRTTSDNRS